MNITNKQFKTVRAKFNIQTMCPFTLGKVKGWSRPAFIKYCHTSHTWELSELEPSLIKHDKSIVITHWLPLSKKDFYS